MEFFGFAIANFPWSLFNIYLKKRISLVSLVSDTYVPRYWLLQGHIASFLTLRKDCLAWY